MGDRASSALAEVNRILGERIVDTRNGGSAIPRSMSPAAQSMNWFPSIIGYGADEAAEGGWTCNQCGYKNPENVTQCENCGHTKGSKKTDEAPDVQAIHDVYWDSGNSKYDEGKAMNGRRMNESLERIGRTLLTEDPKMSPHLQWKQTILPMGGISTVGSGGDTEYQAMGRKGTWVVTGSKKGPANLVLQRKDGSSQQFSEFGSDEEARSFASQSDLGTTGVTAP